MFDLAESGFGLGEVVPPGRLYLAAHPTFLQLEDRQCGFTVQFVLMPYPTPHRFLKGEAGHKYGSPEEKNKLLVAAWADTLREMEEDVQSSISYAGGKKLMDIRKVNYVILGGDNAGEHLLM